MKLIFCDNTLWGLVNFRGEVLKHFVQKGCEVILVAPEKEDAQMQTHIPEGMRFIPISMGRTSKSPLNDLRYFVRLLKIFKSEKPDIVFNYTIKPNIYGSIAAKISGARSVAMMAGLGYVFINDNFVTKVARLLYRFGLHFTTHLLLLNEYSKTLVETKHLCAPQKMILLKGGEGINVTDYPQCDNASPTTTFLYIGRISWDKGYEELSTAVRLLKSRNIDVHIELIGALDPSYPKSVPVERVKKDEAEGLVKYLGFTRDMKSVYKRKGIVVILPSYCEGMNRALMEACASGKPIITTDVPGCREAVEERVNGYIVPARDSKALADAMQRYLELSDDCKKQFSDNSRKRAVNKFDIKSVLAVYDNIVKSCTESCQ